MKNPIKKHTKNTLLASSFAAILISCSSSDPAENDDHDLDHKEGKNSIELTQHQFRLTNLKMGAIEKRTIGFELNVNGMIDVPPQNNVSISTPYGGFIHYMDMLPGTKVKKGQLLVKIKNPEFINFQREYLERKANSEFLKAEYDRKEKLYKENVASAKNYQKSKSNYLSNEASILSLEAQLKMIGMNPSSIEKGNVSGIVSIYSQVTGSVREVHSNMGKYVEPKDVIMDITNSEDLHVELTVYENDIPMLREGQRILFSLANAPDDWREAEVFLIGRSVREDRSVTVHGHLKEPYEDLIPGMYVAARLETDSREVWAVPESSVVRHEGKFYIFGYGGKEMDQGKEMHRFEMLEVKKGRTEKRYTQIDLKDPSLDIVSVNLVTEGAFTLLAAAKNDAGAHSH